MQENFLKGVKKEFEASHKDITVDLQPISASEDDYYTKLQLQMRSPKTSPDLVYEDTFLINSDIEAGYLRPLDDHLEKWDGLEPVRALGEEGRAGAGRQDLRQSRTARTPGRSGTTRRSSPRPACRPTGSPKTWDDVLTAARAIKAKVPGVTPMNVYVGTGVGEAATMQGFEMLLYGTGDTLYDADSKKWVVGSKGFNDALKFVKTLKDEKLMPVRRRRRWTRRGATPSRRSCCPSRSWPSRSTARGCR